MATIPFGKLGRGLPGELERQLRKRESENWSPKQIRDELLKKAKGPRAPWSVNDVPDLRSMQRYVRALRPQEPSAPWTLAGQPADPSNQVVLSVLAHLMARPDSRISGFTNAEADWIVKVKSAAPGLDPWLTWCFVREYMLADGPEEAAPIDALLALYAAGVDANRKAMEVSIRRLERIWPRREFGFWWLAELGFYVEIATVEAPGGSVDTSGIQVVRLPAGRSRGRGGKEGKQS